MSSCGTRTHKECEWHKKSSRKHSERTRHVRNCVSFSLETSSIIQVLKRLIPGGMLGDMPEVC